MKRADEHEVVEIGRSTLAPMPDVVCVKKPASIAARERASSISSAKLAHQPRRRRARRPVDADGPPAAVVEHKLDTAVARQSPSSLGPHHASALDLASAVVSAKRLCINMYDDCCAIGVSVLSDPMRRQRNECIGSSHLERGPERRRLGILFVVDDVRQTTSHTVERLLDHSTLIRGPRTLEPQTASIVCPPVVEVAALVRLDRFLSVGCCGDICRTSDRRGGDSLRPGDQPAFGLGGRVATQLEHLVDRQTLPNRERSEPGSVGAGLRRPQPSGVRSNSRSPVEPRSSERNRDTRRRARRRLRSHSAMASRRRSWLAPTSDCADFRLASDLDELMVLPGANEPPHSTDRVPGARPP